MAENKNKNLLTIILVLVAIAVFLLAVLLMAELLRRPAAEYCGNGVCGLGENEQNCPADCKAVVVPVCGNDKCEAGETTFNCPEDCCPKLAPPYCPGGTLISQGTGANNCPLPPTCCGNDKCEGLENKDNCPADCKEKPPSITRGIYGYAKLITGDCMPPAGPNCIKQYIDTRVKIYSVINTDEMNGTYYVGKSLGWYDRSTNSKIKDAKCAGCEALCLYNGSKSEGWYDSCQDTTNISASLIRWEQCSKGTAKPYCKISKKQPIATTYSKFGFYEITLANGLYSVLAEDPTIDSDDNEYCNSFSNGYACAVRVDNNRTKFDINIDHAVY